MLTDKYFDGVPADSRASRSVFLKPDQIEARYAQIRELGDLAAVHGMSLLHLALRWCLRNQVVTTAIIGARTVAQLDDSLDALEAPALDPALLDAIDLIAPAG
jgi:L-glyceraldehyde 3-phosphate reductase